MNKLLLVFFLSSVGLLRAQESKPVSRLDFEGFVKLAEEKGLALGESAAQLEYSQARVSLAKAQAYPQLKFEILGGPTPTISGNSLQSETSYSDWGVAFQSQLELIVPVYAFGALGELREAAQAAHQAEGLGHERNRWLLRKEIAKFYYGYQLAFELRELLTSLDERLEQALKEGERLRSRRSAGAPSLMDLDRLKTQIFEVKARKAEAQKYLDQARLGMAWKTGVLTTSGSVDELPRWARANLIRREQELNSLETYLEISKARPEYEALRLEAEARYRLYNSEKSRSLPVLFAGARWSLSNANKIADQSSYFAHDPFNQNSVIAGVGLRWNFFSFEQRAKTAMAKAEWTKAEAKRRHWEPALRAELEKNYSELKFWREAVTQRFESEKATSRVALDSYSGFALGTVKAKDLLEAIGAQALAKKSYLESLYNEHLSWVEFESSISKNL